jgi:cellulose synthase operon protein C
MLPRFLLAIALAGALAPRMAWADAADDQYAVAAGHYARGRWQFAAEEFQKFLAAHPQHPKATSCAFFLPECLVQLGKFDESRTLFRDFLTKNPEHRYARQAMYRVGETSFLLGDLAAAKTELEAFQAKFPDDALNAHVLPYLGDLALTAGELDRAKTLFSNGLTRFPEGRMQDDCRFGLARASERLGQIEEASRLYLALAAKAASPLADDAQFELGSLEYEQGDFDAALKTFEAFESTFKDSPYKSRARLGRGWALFQLKQFDKAHKFFQVLAKQPEVALEAGYWLGLTEKAQEKWIDAAATLRGIEVDPFHPLAPAIAFHTADALLRAGDAAAAAPMFDQVVTQWPASEWADDALLGRAQAALALSDQATVDSATAQLQEQHANSPLLADAQRAKASSLLARKLYPDAIAILEPLVAAGAQSPNFADRYLLAAALAGAKRHEDALKLLDPVVGEPTPELRIDASLAQAASLVALERFDQAIAPLEAALAAKPDESRVARAQAQLAVCYARTKQLDKARAAYDALSALKPAAELLLPTTQAVADGALSAGDAAWSRELFAKMGDENTPAEFAAKGLSGLAWSQFEAGQLEESAATFERLLTRFPNDPLAAESALARAQVLEKLNQPEPALAAYRLVIDTYSTSPELPSALLGAARLHDALQQDEQAAACYARLLAEFPDLPERDTALYQGAWVLRQLNKPDEADALFDQLRTQFPKSKFYGDATYRLAERAHQSQNDEQASALLTELLAAEPAADVAQHALYLQGQIAIGRQQWDALAAAMKQLIEKHPDTPLRLRAEYWIADALYKQGQFDQAAAAFSDLAPKLVGRTEKWTPMASLRLAQSLVQQGKWIEARRIAEQLRSANPDFEQMYEVDYVLGRCLAKQAEMQEAREAFSRVINSEAGRGTETAAMAQWMTGETHYHQKDYETALREFLKVEILYDYPVWQSAALLEAGKCHEQLGEWKQAAELYARVVKEFPNSAVSEESEKRLKAARERLAARP